MKKKYLFLKRTVSILSACLMLTLIFAGCAQKEESVSVKSEMVELGNVYDYLSISGTTQPIREKKYFGSGDVEEVYVKVGQTVKKDDNLVRYKGTEFTPATYLKADFDGTVTALNAVKGSADFGQLPVVTVADLNRLKAVCQVGKGTAAQIKANQRVVIKEGEETQDTFISFVGPTAITTSSLIQSETTVTVEFELKDLSTKVIPGFEIDAEVLVASASHVIRIMSDSLKYDSDNKPFVFLIENDKVRKVPVEIGLQSDDYIEIKTGIAENNLIVYNPPSNLTDGAAISIEGSAAISS